MAAKHWGESFMVCYCRLFFVVCFFDYLSLRKENCFVSLHPQVHMAAKLMELELHGLGPLPAAVVALFSHYLSLRKDNSFLSLHPRYTWRRSTRAKALPATSAASTSRTCATCARTCSVTEARSATCAPSAGGASTRPTPSRPTWTPTNRAPSESKTRRGFALVWSV